MVVGYTFKAKEREGVLDYQRYSVQPFILISQISPHQPPQ